MSQNVPLDTGDVADEAFFDATQEMLSGLAVNLALTLLSSTAIRVPAGTGHDQVSVSIQGQYRFVTANVDRTVPAGGAGDYDIFVTASANGAPTDVPPSAPPGDDYSFSLAIVASGGTPSGVGIYRKVGTLTWNGSAITVLRQIVNAVTAERLAPALKHATAGLTLGVLTPGQLASFTVLVPGAIAGDLVLVSNPWGDPIAVTGATGPFTGIVEITAKNASPVTTVSEPAPLAVNVLVFKP